MSEICPKCGSPRTQFEGQTSWECGSYQSLIGGSHIKTPAFKLIESEHCLCRTALAAATKRAEEAERKLAEANEPFGDADPRIEIFQRDGYYGCKLTYGETAPFKTWREAYRFGESFWGLRDINKQLAAAIKRAEEAEAKIEQLEQDKARYHDKWLNCYERLFAARKESARLLKGFINDLESHECWPKQKQQDEASEASATEIP